MTRAGVTVQYETIPVRTYREARRIPKVSYLEVVGIPMHLRGKGGEASVSGVESSSAATTGGALPASIVQDCSPPSGGNLPGASVVLAPPALATPLPPVPAPTPLILQPIAPIPVIADPTPSFQVLAAESRTGR